MLAMTQCLAGEKAAYLDADQTLAWSNLTQIKAATASRLHKRSGENLTNRLIRVGRG
jgi:hypothetical protein